MNNIDFSRQRYVDLLSNAGFSAVFADEKNSDVVIDFLNIILEGERVVKSIRYVRNEFGGLTVSAKGVRFDLVCEDADGTKFVVEMQKRRHSEDFFTRSMFYGATVYSNQLSAGDIYGMLKPTYVIGIMEDALAEEKSLGMTDVVSRYCYMEKDRRFIAPNTIMLIFVQLRNFKMEVGQCKTAFEKWCYTCKNAVAMEEKPDNFDEESLKRLFTACEIAQFSKDKFEAYSKDMMKEFDYRNDMWHEREEGRAEGLAEGEIKGEAKAQQEIARKMKAKYPVEDIAEMTGLSVDEIHEL